MQKLAILIVLVVTAAVALSQEPAKTSVPVSQNNPFSAHNKLLFAGTKITLLSTAEKVPPTPIVSGRSCRTLDSAAS